MINRVDNITCSTRQSFLGLLNMKTTRFKKEGKKKGKIEKEFNYWEKKGDRERERERERPRRLRGARRATLLLKRCSPKRFGKQRATGRLRSVINHFLLRKKRARRNVSSCRETRFPIHEPPNFESKKNPFLYYSSWLKIYMHVKHCFSINEMSNFPISFSL